MIKLWAVIVAVLLSGCTPQLQQDAVQPTTGIGPSQPKEPRSPTAEGLYTGVWTSSETGANRAKITIKFAPENRCFLDTWVKGKQLNQNSSGTFRIEGMTAVLTVRSVNIQLRDIKNNYSIDTIRLTPRDNNTKLDFEFIRTSYPLPDGRIHTTENDGSMLRVIMARAR